MMELDPALLARIQFATNITFHILFPSITIALGWVLLFFKMRFNATKNEKWMEAYFFWTKIFALCFAMGVVSGITMSFQFGTNWPGFMETVGNIAGPLLAYEILTAFFLEATFLGIMLFGFSRVPAWMHNAATFLVAFGTTVSAFWILALNSWMQTPAGFEMRDGVAHATDWFQIVFNPSFPYRLTHMLLASGVTASFLVAGLSAYRWLRHDRTPAVMAALKTGVLTAAILIPLQIFTGDLHGLNTLQHQPQKVAAMEGLWETKNGAPLVLFALPNKETRQNDLAIEIPKLASLILTHEWDGELKGINAFENNHPPVAQVFWAFRVMVGTGLLMLAVSWSAVFFLWKRKDLVKPLAYAMVPMAFSGWVATVSGWYVTEIGRQPWLVTGVLKTADAISDTPAPIIGISLSMYLTVYAVLMTAFITTLFYMARKAGQVKKDPLTPASGQAVVEALD
ncbi:MAG: cytochrome ubiquinol oxidase subunit I [Bdellovibrionales bacterium]|jgi:cytochrome d ubiquinol oxidase subunit I|nr:cytochrome ubiquinol oxidase subunit I [Bdellovibrionales bacterium]